MADSGVCFNASNTGGQWRGKWGTRRADTTSEEIESLVRDGPLSPFVVDVDISEDEEAIARATKISPSEGVLVQKALRARCLLCFVAVERREVNLGRRYDFIVRARPDYAFDCSFPPASALWWHTRLTAWASAHRDYWEIMSRDVSEAALQQLWTDAAIRLDACRPKKGSTEAASRVESCLYFALCAAGADVHAADRYYNSNQERKAARDVRRANASVPPDAPGVIVRPCCDPHATPGTLLLPLHTATCNFDHIPVLGHWYLSSAALQGQVAWTDLRIRLLKDLGPQCKEQLPIHIPPPPGDDDDGCGDDDSDDRSPAKAVKVLSSQSSDSVHSGSARHELRR